LTGWNCAHCGEPITGEIVWGETAGAFHPECRAATIWVMPKSLAQRQAEFKAAQKAAGLVRLEAYVTKEQRDKFRALGGDPWLRKKIDQAKVKT
jgi:hypothetical protein